MSQPRVHIAVLSIAGPTGSTVTMENIVADRLTEAGHVIRAFDACRSADVAIRAQLTGWVEDPDIDLVIVLGESAAMSRALKPLVDQPLPGFAELLRKLAVKEAGISVALSNAEAARCGSTFVFVLPAHDAAVRAAMDNLILPHLDPRMPKNLLASMPRISGATNVDVTKVDIDISKDVTRVGIDVAQIEASRGADHTQTRVDSVPTEVPKEQTQRGGMSARLPATSPAMLERSRSRTGKNVIRKVEDPTKPIELQKLEEQLAMSKPSEETQARIGDSTKPLDLGKPMGGGTAVTRPSASLIGDSTKPMDLGRLPKLPPGASQSALDEPAIAPPKNQDPGVTKVYPAMQKQAPKASERPASVSRTQQAPIVPPRAPGPIGVAKAPRDTVVDKAPRDTVVDKAPRDTVVDINEPVIPLTTRRTPPSQQPAMPPRAEPVGRDSGGLPPRAEPVARPEGAAARIEPRRSEPGSAFPRVVQPAAARQTPAVQPIARVQPATPPAKQPSESARPAASEPPPLQPVARVQPEEPTPARQPSESARPAASEPPPIASPAAQPSAVEEPPATADEEAIWEKALSRAREEDAPAAAASEPAREKRESARVQPPAPDSAPIATPAIASAPAASAPAAVPAASPPAASAPAAVPVASSAPAAIAVARPTEPSPAPETVETLEPDEILSDAEAFVRALPAKPPEPAPEPPKPKQLFAPAPPKLEDILPQPVAVVADLPRGEFHYPTIRKSKTPIVIGVIVVLAAAGIAGFFLLNKGGDDKKPVAAATPDAAVEQPVAPSIDAAPEQVAAVEVDAASEPVPEIETPPPVEKPAVQKPVEKPKPKQTNAAIAKPDTPKDTPKEKPEVPKDTPKEKPDPTDDPGCDETACVLEKYARACCAKYKPKDDGFKPSVATSTENLDKPQIKAGVDKMRAKVLDCKEKHVGVKGTVKLAISVDPDGNVSELSVVTSPDDGLGECVAAALRKAKFAKTTNGGSFTYPFVF